MQIFENHGKLQIVMCMTTICVLIYRVSQYSITLMSAGVVVVQGEIWKTQVETKKTCFLWHFLLEGKWQLFA